MMNYAYLNGHILDGTAEMQVQDGLAVLTEGEKIVGLVPAGEVPEGYAPVNLDGRYLLPGLINMHVHLAGNGKPQKKQRDNAKLVELLMGSSLLKAAAYRMVAGFAKIEVMSGVTTIRTVGWLGDFDTRLRDGSPRESGWAPAFWQPTRASPSPAGTWRAPWPWRRQTSHRLWPR